MGYEKLEGPSGVAYWGRVVCETQARKMGWLVTVTMDEQMDGAAWDSRLKRLICIPASAAG